MAIEKIKEASISFGKSATSASDLKKVDELQKTGTDVNFSHRGGSAALLWAIESAVPERSTIDKTETALVMDKPLNVRPIMYMPTQPTPPPPRNEETPKASKPRVSFATELKTNDKAQVFGENSLDGRLNMMHGYMYQLKLLMLFLYRGVSRKYSFRLGTEIPEARKFDDLVFEYDFNGKRMFKLLQAKHKLVERKKITAASFLAKKDDSFNLAKYFFSHLELKKTKLFSEGSIKDLTICTNIDFDFKTLVTEGITLERIEERDEILDFDYGRKASARYKLGGGIVDWLKSRLLQPNARRYATADIYTDNDIAEFVNCLVFAINQPNEDELGNIIKYEMSREFDFAENAYNKLFVSMLNWFTGKEKDTFLTYEHGKEFILGTDRNTLGFGVKDPAKSFSGQSEFLNNSHEISNTEKGQSRFVCDSGLGGVGKSELARKYVSTYGQECNNKIAWINAESHKTLADYSHRLPPDQLKISMVNVDEKAKTVNSIVKDVYPFFENGKEFIVGTNNIDWFGVKDPVESFTGRSEFLNNLHEILNTEKGKSQFVCVSGLGGVGKSELVRKYVSTYREEYNNKIIWINAENDKTLANSFRRLAHDRLNISMVNANEKKKTVNSIVEDVYASFNCQKCLFIFDNAKNHKNTMGCNSGIKEFLPCLPDSSNRVHVLVTSRNQMWPDNFKVLLLNVFSKDEASEFVRKSLKLADDDQTEEVGMLVDEVEFLPLALQQAVAYIGLQDRKLQNVGSKFRISNYLENFEQKSKEYFKFDYDSKSIYSTWDSTLNTIQKMKNGATTCEILEILSYFGPTNIYVQAFKALIKDKIIAIRKTGKPLPPALILPTAIDSLKQYSIIDVRGKKIVLNRLVAKVIRWRLQDQSREQEILYKALKLFSTAKLNLFNIEHAISVWNHSCKYSMFIDEFSLLPRNIIDVLLNRLRLEEAEVFAMKVSEQLNTLASKSYATQLNLIATTEYAALALLYRGKYELSAKYYEDSCEMLRRIFGPNSLTALKSEDKVCRCLIEMNQYDRASELCEKIIELRSETLVKNHLDASDTLYNKATILYHQGNIAESLSILKEVLSIRELFLRENHPDTLYLKSSIAVLVSDLGEFSKATELVQELPLQRAIHYIDISTEILTKYNVGAVFVRAGEFAKALPIFKDAYESNSEIFGKDHHISMMIRYKIGDSLRAAGKYQEALQILEQIYDQQTKILGPDHPDTIFTKNSIGYTLVDVKKFAKALEHFQDSLEKCRIVLGQEHRTTLFVIRCIAEILTRQIKYDKSYMSFYINHMTKYRLELLKIQKLIFGEDHKEYLAMKHRIELALCYSYQSDDASPIHEEISSKELIIAPKREVFYQKVLKVIHNEKLGKNTLRFLLIIFLILCALLVFFIAKSISIYPAVDWSASGSGGCLKPI